MVEIKFRESNWVFSDNDWIKTYTESPVNAWMCASDCAWREILPLSTQWILTEEPLKKKKKKACLSRNLKRWFSHGRKCWEETVI